MDEHLFASDNGGRPILSQLCPERRNLGLCQGELAPYLYGRACLAWDGSGLSRFFHVSHCGSPAGRKERRVR